MGGQTEALFKNHPSPATSYLTLDSLEIGRSNRIPLWLFGFIY